MDRYSELKLLLKSWEGNFQKEHDRKPTKADIEDAPEETQNMYREFRALRQKREANVSKSFVQDEAADQDTENQGPDSWGSHLNRSSVTPKMSPAERSSLTASAQYYGMKLKCKLGGAGKDRPLSLKKPSTPRSSGHVEKKPVPSPACVLPKPSMGLNDDDPSDPAEDLPLLGLRASRMSLTPSSHDGVGKKLHQLQSKVGQRLSSLNHDWLQRCELREARAGSGGISFAGTKAGTGPVGPQERRTCSVDTHSPDSAKDHYEARQEVMSLDDTKACAMSAEEIPRMITSAATERRDLPSQNLTKVDTKTEELGHQNHPTPNRKKDVFPVQLQCTEAEERAQDSMDSEVTSCRKRQRDTTNDPDTGDAPSQKRRKARVTPEKRASKESTVEEDSEVPKVTSEKRASKESTMEEDSEVPKMTSEKSRKRASKKSTIEEDSEVPKVTSEKSRKRASKKSTVEEDSEVPKVTTEKSRKRASKKSTIEEDPEVPKVTSEKRKKRASKKSTMEEDSEDPPKTEVTGRITENILGEVIEEEAASRIASPAMQCTRGPQRKNENFVRINLKKKSHVKSFVLNGNRLRKQMWKQKWQKKGEQFGGGGKHFNRSGDTCFHCGRMGHWASQCPGKVLPVIKPEEPEPAEEDITLPSLEDVARMTNSQLGTEMEVCEDRHDVSHEVVRQIHEPAPPPTAMKPLYELEPSGAVRETPPEVYAALAELGYRSFRPGQEEAVMRILSGLSSLVILSTGTGKSLCYQLPAYLYSQRSPCITLVISPLVSLMDDQVSGLPSKLKAVCIHSNMTKNQREAAMDKVKQGKVHVLLLSPEALVGGGLSGSSCLPPADQLPPVAFACIDEVHCVSEWSHNFRPCYLRLCKVLRERLGVRCLLGLTATATLSTAQDVARHLEVSDSGKMPLRLAAVPPNLHLSVSMDQDRDQALVTLLKGDRFGCLDSIIIYCTRREETQRLSALLRTCLQGVTVSRTAEEKEAMELDQKKIQARKKIRRPLKWMADTYHAGLSAAERRRVQNNFMSGQLRIVVATVAFGMGLDKSDVRGIIHYNMPKNFESYVQEIGRAGRDGKDAHCHLFLDRQSQDLDELRRHVYGDSVDYITVKKLVQRVFPRCKCWDIQKKREALRRGCEVDDDEMLDILAQCDGQEGTEDRPAAVEDRPAERICHGHERVLPIEETVQALDVREEGIETLLCYLELHPSQWLELLHPTLSVCRVTCYSGPQQLRGVAHSCPPVAVALAWERLSGIDHTHASSVEFNVVEVADSMGWEVFPVKRALRDLQWNSSTNGGFRGTGRSGVLVEFSKLSFHFRSYGDLTDEEFEDICDFLHQKVSSREATALRQLRLCYRVFQSVAYRSSSACAERVNMERSNQLKAHILEYFKGKDPLEDEAHDDDEEELRDKKAEDWKPQLSCDIRHFLSIHQEERFSGRAIARIFHGIGSPCYPAQVYGRDRRFWRKYLHLDFNKVMQICKEEVIRMR